MNNLKKDQFGNYIYTDPDIIDLLYQGYTNLNFITAKNTVDIKRFNQESDIKINTYTPCDLSVDEFDNILQQDWFMPEEYKNLDIYSWILENTNVDTLQRVNEEILLYQEKNLTNLLRWLKYFVDSCREKKIVWGVGRGSSVASYVLYVIGVHRIDSIKYGLDYKEFLR